MPGKKHTKFLIGIDDTDNADSRGTGFLSRQLAHALETTRLAKVVGITRHQLFVDPAIRYTSQNSSACIKITAADQEVVTAYCADYLLEYSAPGSDAGLCIAPYDEVDTAIIEWGEKAKNTVLDMDEAFSIAREENIYLEGFTGNHEGIIGALAAIGLYAGGSDGRYIWRKGIKELREMDAGIYSTKQLMTALDLDKIASLHGEQPAPGERILINEWVRPIRKDHKAVLIVQRTEEDDEFEWKLTGKEIIRTIS
jgi:hypothetical protein